MQLSLDKDHLVMVSSQILVKNKKNMNNRHDYLATSRYSVSFFPLIPIPGQPRSGNSAMSCSREFTLQVPPLGFSFWISVANQGDLNSFPTSLLTLFFITSLKKLCTGFMHLVLNAFLQLIVCFTFFNQQRMNSFIPYFFY